MTTKHIAIVVLVVLFFAAIGISLHRHPYTPTAAEAAATKVLAQQMTHRGTGDIVRMQGVAYIIVDDPQTPTNSNRVMVMRCLKCPTRIFTIEGLAKHGATYYKYRDETTGYTGALVGFAGQTESQQ